MESRFINRYHTFCKCLNNLEKSKTASPDADVKSAKSACT